MSRSQADVLNYLMALTPPGDALDTGEGSPWQDWQQPLAEEIALYETLNDQMLVEVNPGEAVLLLPDWEQLLGPDPYGRDKGTLTIAQRQALALSRYTDKRGVRPADFEALGVPFGITVSIQEFRPTGVGNAHAGDRLVSAAAAYCFVVTMPPSGQQTVAPVIAGRKPAAKDVVFQYTGTA